MDVEGNNDTFKLIIVILRTHGPLTSGEICEKAEKYGLWRRLSEMQLEGLIRVNGQRRCRVNKRLAKVWELTD